MLDQIFKSEHLAVLTTTCPISMKHVGDHLKENWSAYTKGLTENEQLRVIILCGVHGGHDGKVGRDARNRVKGIPGYFYYPGTGIPGYFRKNTRVYPGIQNPLHKKQKSSLMSWKMH